MIKTVNGNRVAVCDECGSIILWKVDSTAKHGLQCTKCLDKKRGLYRVIDFQKDELEYAGYDTDILSDDILSDLQDYLRDSLSIGPLWDAIDEFFETRGIGRKSSGKAR